MPSIWLQPTYRFTLPEGNQLRPYYFDVTKSAVLFETKGDLAQNLDWAVDKTGKRHPKILEFGAGRLRNTIYLLEKGHPVTAVEFGSLTGAESVRPYLDRARRFGQSFSELIFPHDFFASEQKFDLILLVNVLNIMPVPSERILALQYCRDKLEEDGLILWYSQTKEYSYKDKPLFCDGKMSTSHRFKTFYKDYEEEEIDELFAANGMRLENEWEGAAARHFRSRLFKSLGKNPTKPILSASLIRRYVKGDREFAEPEEVTPSPTSVGARGRPNVPDPKELSSVELYAQALPRISPGIPSNNTYQNLIGAIFSRLFFPQLVEFEFEKKFNEGRDRIDIVYRNHATSGFFSRFPLRGFPFVYIECKNYSHDLRPGEINQSIERITNTRSHLAIIACRKNRNRTLIRSRCRDFNNGDERNMLFWLEDNDVLSLLENAAEPEEMNEILMRRVDEVTPS